MIQIIAKLAKLPLDFAIFLILAVLLLGSQFVYGEMSMQMTNVMFVYAIMYLWARQSFKKAESQPQTLAQAAPSFIIAFLITAGAMALLQPVLGGVLVASTLEASIALPLTFGVLHAFIKSHIEEAVFRNRLTPLVGPIGQAILFGVFHFFVLYMTFGFTAALFGAIAWLSMLGYLWYRVMKYGGQAAATGSHFGYNVVVFGLLPVITGALVV